MTTAFAAFLAKKTEIDAKLARLVTISAEHFYADPDAIDWGDVGDLERLNELLTQATDAAFREGENA